MSTPPGSARWASLLGAAVSVAAPACSHDWNGLLRDKDGGGVGAAGGAGAASAGGSGGDQSSSGSGGAGGSASSSGGAGAAAGAGGAGGCPTGAPGPALVEVPATTGGAYCVDATEVTNQDYATFLATAPSTGSQPAYCAFNVSFAPSAGWPAPAGNEQVPVKSVDWCDALAYCAYAGKHLCGKVGGGPNAPANWASAASSEWFNACSGGGALDYPYGDVYQPIACNGADYGAGAPVAVTSAAACTGGVPGLHDMSGNVWEWEDSCSASTGASDTCHIRGGGFINPGAQLSCDADSFGARSLTSGNIGFRCCADLGPA